eukprot:14937_1
MSTSTFTSVFERIDAALNRYYISLEKSDYMNTDGIGKFLAFCRQEEFDVNEIDEELDDIEDCMYLDFDDSFPFLPEYRNKDDFNKRQFIFDLIKKCYANPAIKFESNNPGTHNIQTESKKPETDYIKTRNKYHYLMDLTNIDDKMQKQALNSCQKYAKNMLVGPPSKNKDLCLIIAFGIFYNKPILRFIVDAFDLWRIENDKSNRVIIDMIQNNKRFANYINKMDDINKHHHTMIRFKGKFSNKIVMAVGCEKRIARPILLKPSNIIHDNLTHYIHYVECIDDFIQKCKEQYSVLTMWHLDVMIIPKKVTNRDGDLCEPIIMTSVDDILNSANIKFVKEVCIKNKISEFKLNGKLIEFSKRTIMIIDRRDGLRDIIYYYQPQGSSGKISEVAVTYLPESNLSNSKEIILPKYGNNNNKIHAFTSHPKLFVLSYHMFGRNSIRVYWAVHGNKTRFNHDCIWKVWPNYFASKISESDKNKFKEEWAMNKGQHYVFGDFIYADSDFDMFCKENV